MKKTLISFTMIAAMLISLGGWVYAENGQDLQPQAEEEVFVPGDVPAESGAVDGMIPINALVLCMLEQDLSYDETSEVFFWNGLYHMIGLYGQMDSRAEFTDDTLILPTETVEDYAAALYTNYSGLPQLPGELRDRVNYDPQTDSYLLSRGDAGLSETTVKTVKTLTNGEVQVTGALVALEDDSELCAFSATLTENDSMFGYSISALEILP